MSTTEWIIVVATVLACALIFITIFWLTCRALKKMLAVQKAETAWRQELLLLLKTPPCNLHEALERFHAALKAVEEVSSTTTHIRLLMDLGYAVEITRAQRLMEAHETVQAVLLFDSATPNRPGEDMIQAGTRRASPHTQRAVPGETMRQRALEKAGLTEEEASRILEGDALEVVVELCDRLYHRLRPTNAQLSDIVNELEFGLALANIVKTTQSERRARIADVEKRESALGNEIAAVRATTGIDLSFATQRESAGASMQDVSSDATSGRSVG